MNGAPPGITAERQALAALLAARSYHELTTEAAKELERTPGDTELLSLVVTGLINFGRTSGVIDTLHKALAVNPSSDFALLGIGLILEKNKVEESRHYFRRLFALENDSFFETDSTPGFRMAPVITLDQWCEAHESIVYHPPEDVTVVNPAIGAEQRYRCDAVRGTTIPSASIVAGWDFVISPAGEVIDGSGFQDLNVVSNLVRHVHDAGKRRVVHPWPTHCIDVEEDGIFLSGPPVHQFGNWVSDFLPRLIAWKRNGARPLKIVTLRGLNQPQCDTLSLLGVRENDIFWCDVGQSYRFRTLHVMQPGHIYRPHPQVTRFLYQGLGPDPATRPQRRTLGRRFFLERSATHRGRNIVNQAEMNEVLEEAGFETIRRPEISVPQQNVMFQTADIIVSAFGTDLITIYQLRPGTDVVALYFEYMIEPETLPAMNAFAGLCATIGVRLHYVYCRSTQKEGLKNGYYQDMIIDCNALRECLDEILVRRSLEYAGDWTSSKPQS